MTTENPPKENPPAHLEVPLIALVELAIECWRLERWLAAQPHEAPTAQARHVARRLGKFLDEREVHGVDLTGQEYAPGLAVEVLDVTELAGVPAGVELIAETIAPVVMWRGAVVKYGQVVVSKNRC